MAITDPRHEILRLSAALGSEWENTEVLNDQSALTATYRIRRPEQPSFDVDRLIRAKTVQAQIFGWTLQRSTSASDYISLSFSKGK